MKRTIARTALLLVLYAVIIFGIFVLQFTKGETFSSLIGIMTVSGRYDISTSKTSVPLLPVHIVANGIDFYISEQDMPTATTIHEETISLKVLAYEINEDSFVIRCSEQTAFSFISEKRGDTDIITITATMPETLTSVGIPWKLTQNARIERVNNEMRVHNGNRQFAFVGTFEFESRDLSSSTVYACFSHDTPHVSYKTYVKPQGLQIDQIISHPNATAEACHAAEDQFAAAALQSFKTEFRSRKYDEDVVAAYIAEMARRSMYRAALENIPLRVLPKSERSFLTAPFYGNVQQTYTALLTRERKKRDRLAKLISEKKIECFEVYGLLPYLMSRGSGVMVADLQEMITTLDFTELTPSAAVGILEIITDFPVYFPQEKNPFEKVQETCERKIMDALFLLDDGLFFSSDKENVDTTTTLQAACILTRYGQAVDALAWEKIGRLLYTSIFKFAGNSAYLPVSFKITKQDTTINGLVIADTGVLPPERLYPYALPKNTYYPHAWSLNPEQMPATWAWTAARSVTITRPKPQLLAIETEFFVGATHYLILRGIPPFRRIEIHNLDFRTDPRFEKYDSSGYVYNAGTKTLYLKLKHRVEKERILLYLSQ